MNSKIGWKFYLCFIIPGYIFAVGAWFLLPDTRHLPLEEIAAIFGDKDEIYLANQTLNTMNQNAGVTKLSEEMNGKYEHSEHDEV